MGSQPSTPSLLLSGTYTCTIKDAIGCTLQKSITIHEPDKLTVSFITIPSSCHQSTGEIEILTSGGTGNKNYYWMHNGSKEGRIKILQAGDYSVLVRDTNGCPVLATAMLEDKDGPVIISKNISHATCFGGGNTGGGRAELNVTGGSPPYAFQWSGQESDTSVLLNARAGNYSVKITDDVGCITVDTITILQPDTFKVSVSVVHTNCGAAQGVATAVVNGGSSPYNYAWSISAINNRQISNLNSGEGNVTVTDSFGCKASHSFEVLDNNSLTVTGTVLSNAICFPDSGGSAMVTVISGTAPYKYIWYPQGGSNNIANGLPPDNYKITVIDANGCRQRAKLKIESPEELKAYIELFGPSNDSALNGSAQAIVYGGKAPYTYKWSTGSESSNIMGMAIGDYWLRVTDQNGCVQSTFRKIPPTNNICDRNCDNSNLSPCGPFPFPNCNYPCTATVIRNIITDFGAVGNGIADDQCAFEAASYFFNNLPSYVTKVLNIPFGIYLVGRQEPNMGWFLKGQSVLCFSQISNMSILGILGPAGEKPVLKYKSCMKYGAFNNNPTFPLTRYLTCPGTPCNIIGYPYYPKVAYVGNMIRFSSCHNINVSQLELNGNIEEAIIGGGISDGIQFDYDGIYLNACYNINLDNLNIHHFGHDGIWILDDYCFPNNVIYPPYPNHSLGVISNTIIEYNGRNGLSWQGGSGLTVFNSQFNYTGQSRITEQPGAGIDIEFGHSRTANAHGLFQNCIIKYNHLHGLICDADDHGTELWSYDYRFKNCTFIGCSTGDVLWPNSRNFEFKDCDFFGSVLRAYDARVSSSSQNISNNDNIKFLDCNFAEEYDDPDPLIPLSSLSQGLEENVPQPQCLSGGADYLINFGLATRVRMENCNITTNFTSKLIRLSADLGMPPTPTFNRNSLFDCNLLNYGYNGCNCDVDLTAIYHTNLLGPVRVLTIGVTGINNEPTSVGCPDGSGGILHWYLHTINQSSCSPNPIGNLWWTAHSLLVSTPAPKLIVPTSPNQEPLFWCTPCPYLIPSSYPQFCDFNSYKRKKIITNEEVLNTIKIFPNPAMEYFIIQNVLPGEQGKHPTKYILRNSFS